MNVNISLGRRFHSTIPRLAIVPLIVLVWSSFVSYSRPNFIAPAFVNTPFDYIYSGPFFEAVRLGDLPTIKAMLKDKPEQVSIRDNHQRTPLHWATENGRKEAVELLLANKADINDRDMDGKRPLHAAATGGNKDIVELLLNNKAEVNAEDYSGNTPLNYAANKDVAELLRRHGGHLRK
jgi:ankyrin repeat protein